jgi:hypothetical protein
MEGTVAIDYAKRNTSLSSRLGKSGGSNTGRELPTYPLCPGAVPARLLLPMGSAALTADSIVGFGPHLPGNIRGSNAGSHGPGHIRRRLILIPLLDWAWMWR